MASDVHQPLSQIRISLASSLGVGQVIFLAGINATEDKVRGLSRFFDHIRSTFTWWFPRHRDRYSILFKPRVVGSRTCRHLVHYFLLRVKSVCKVPSPILLQRLNVRRNAFLIYSWRCSLLIDHFTVVCSVTWPFNGSEAGHDLVLIQTLPLLLCKSSCSYAN